MLFLFKLVFPFYEENKIFFSVTKLNEKYLLNLEKHLNKRFRKPINQMDYLSIMICATKK
ncbi:hypothetical protein B188_05390 [Candidatus Brocadiaceae bacterium B188]|nr:hypothetical protein B188_05390 [Candidatus Brocadiaceae bacterium B188]